MRVRFLLAALSSGLTLAVHSQINAGLFLTPDVSENQIVFSYANNLWLVPKSGGNAIQLSSPAGVESFPKFSPDGKTIAFSGNYGGNLDVYTMPAVGGAPRRLTSHGMPDRVVDWHPDGNQVLFASSRASEKQRYSKFFLVPAAGGSPEMLPLAYAEFGSWSPDKKQMAVVIRTEIFRTWKRYRGGDAADIHIYNFQTKTSENISAKAAASQELPMWHGSYIYFLSDQGPELRMNLWRYDTRSKTSTQVTHFKEYDVHFPSMGPSDIVLEAGGKLYCLQLATQALKEVNINLVSDFPLSMPALKSVANQVQHFSISPDGNRALVEARGEIFSVPAEHGYVKNLTQSSGVAERNPAWSPDGKSIAYWSDETGEYELWLREANTEAAPKKITSYGPGFRYRPHWSPDSKKIAFVDKAMRIKILDLASGTTAEVDQARKWMHGPLENFSGNWSPDSRWFAYERDLENDHAAIFVFDTRNQQKHQITSGFYHSSDPAFDTEGKYLYLATNQHFQPNYSDLDGTWIYPNTTKIAAIALKKSTKPLLFTKNDQVELKKDEETKEDKKGEGKEKDKDKDKNKEKDKGKEDPKPEKPKIPAVEIDFEDIESRLELLPPSPGNLGRLSSVKGKIIYMRFPNTGTEGGKASLKYFDTDKREEKTILDDINQYRLSADGKKVLVSRMAAMAIIKPEENQKFEKPLRLAEMETMVDPRQEWNQIFLDAWRLERDYFYDEQMHGVDWNKVKLQYQELMKSVNSREELNQVIGEMIAELNASHTYRGGGELEQPAQKAVGYLGVDWTVKDGYYAIGKIVRGASWDAETRSSLDVPGCPIKEGDYILAVNGIPLKTDGEPYLAFQGLAGKAVELTYNKVPGWQGAKTEVVTAMASEIRLRNLAWIEANRKRVDEATGGQAGYIYVPSTGIDGQTELIRQYNAQWNKKSLIIDERFNNGGQIPDRFIELLNRPPLAFWATRDGQPWTFPTNSHFGPKVMLINGWSGSGGDAFPDYFKQAGLGPLIGMRTWGGLIGISGVPPLIDGGTITAPSFRMYYPKGGWFPEGHGVDPDIEVDENLGSMANGTDPQLERAIQEIKDLMLKKPFNMPERPAKEVR